MNYIKTAEALQVLGISRTTLHHLRKRGLPSYKVGASVRFLHHELVEWVAKNGTPVTMEGEAGVIVPGEEGREHSTSPASPCATAEEKNP